LGTSASRSYQKEGANYMPDLKVRENTGIKKDRFNLPGETDKDGIF